MVADSTKVPRYRVLVVDDDRAVLDAVARGLRAEGQDVVSSESFEEARRLLGEQRFDALIADVRLGPANGLQLAIIARQMDPAMRLIVFSGFDDPVLRAEAGRVNAIYVTKPVSTAALMQLLRDPDI
jgi:two-component system, NtrC family, response regulator HydG